MPRTRRASQAGYCYQVLNRGNACTDVFHKPGDYSAFLHAVGESSIRLPIRLIAYCLMPNHFHLIVRPNGDGDVSHWMQWLLTTHVRRYLTHYGHSGHVWQGRFKAFAIRDDDHLVTAVSYVERNPLRANLVANAEDWPWSSVGVAQARLETAPQLASEELLRCSDWLEFVNSPMTAAESESIRLSIRRDRLFGTEQWTRATAASLGLESRLRSRGGQHRKASILQSS